MNDAILSIPVSIIHASPWQGRFIEGQADTSEGPDGEMLKLAESIRENGLLQPIVVRKTGDTYELIDGHRRLEAHKLLAFESIDAIVRDLGDRETQVMTLVANLQRKNLHNIERAMAFRKILDAGIFNDKKELSQAIGKDETYVGDLLNTLNMDKRIIDDLLHNKTTNDVRALRAIRKAGQTDENGNSDPQWELYRRFIDDKLNRKEVFSLSRKERSFRQKELKIHFMPRRIEIELPRKFEKKQRDVLTSILKEKLDELLGTGEE
jgi:ParB family chromosome partitioning protein